MKNRLNVFWVCFCIAGSALPVCAQTDSVSASPKKFKWIAPAVLITTGTLTMLDSDADEFFLSNYEVREERNERFLNFSNHADNYLQYAPAAAVLLLSVSGVEGEHTLPNQLALLIKSELVMSAVVYSLKYTVGEARPDSGKKNSFPSGHTAQAFTAATFLAKEYGHKSVWISIGAYTTATTVGVFRMLNNRHWVSDVLVGAGIGILSTEFVYFTHKNRWGKNKVSVTPFSAAGSQGLTLRYVFR
ncbi:MAG: phosphatase PAP2 family protein [Cyclobacteriaceae bacterium]|nr:phosphatase PAP2 family protein [Cyclobacteriaceae bacterium]